LSEEVETGKDDPVIGAGSARPAGGGLERAERGEAIEPLFWARFAAGSFLAGSGPAAI